MSHYPRPILELISQFTRLPGIGPKTAERLVIHLAGRPKPDLAAFARALENLAGNLVTCKECGTYAEKNPCGICGNTQRDRQLICVVAKPQDLLAIERTGDFPGRYHVLGGVFNPLEGVLLEQLRAAPLVERIRRDHVREVILAFNIDVAGEGTALAIKQLLQPFTSAKTLKITKLARGLPMGSDVEYADEVTLSNALQGRREV